MAGEFNAYQNGSFGWGGCVNKPMFIPVDCAATALVVNFDSVSLDSGLKRCRFRSVTPENTAGAGNLNDGKCE